MNRIKTLLKKGDYIIFLVVAVLIVAFGIQIIFQQSEHKQCVILKDNIVAQKIPLDGTVHRQILIEGAFENKIEIDGTRVRVHSSNCPNQFCVHTGWISQPYQSIACLPNHVLVRIESNKPSEIDAVTK